MTNKETKELLKSLIDGNKYANKKDGYTVYFDYLMFESGYYSFITERDDDGDKYPTKPGELVSYLELMPRTYTVHGVELEDLRVVNIDDQEWVYIVTTNRRSYFTRSTGSINTKEIAHYMKYDLVHSTAEGAIAHSKALLGIEQ